CASARAVYPVPRRAASSEPASPCTGRGLASRRVATTLVGSYPTVSPLPPASPESHAPEAVSFLCHFPSAFAAWGFPSVLPFGVRTFLGALRPRGHPACASNCSRPFAPERIAVTPEGGSHEAPHPRGRRCGRAHTRRGRGCHRRRLRP